MQPESPAPSIVVSVGEFAARLREVFRRVRAFESIGISGEISQWSPRPNGVYFTIKDANAVLECFAYNNRAQRFPKVAIGTAVVAYGAVRVVERRSRYELLVDRVELTGIGELYQQYEALKERFRAEGLFEPARKRHIPSFPRRVVLISARGKGAEDFQRVISEKTPHVAVEFIETRVQGVGAEIEIADALDRAARLTVDAIVLARGGGSYEDLFPFNREAVVRAIVRSPIPVITGIGHTGDHHLADDVADLSCETPSNAGQYIVSLWQRGSERLERLCAQLDREMRDLLARALQRGDAIHDQLERAWDRRAAFRRERLAALENRLNRQSPAVGVANRMERLTGLRAVLEAWPARAAERWATALAMRESRIVPALDRLMNARSHALEVRDARLAPLDPDAPLARGYARIEHGGRIVRGTADVRPGAMIKAYLQRGSFDARVESVNEDE